MILFYVTNNNKLRFRSSLKVNVWKYRDNDFLSSSQPNQSWGNKKYIFLEDFQFLLMSFTLDHNCFTCLNMFTVDEKVKKLEQKPNVYQDVLHFPMYSIENQIF